MINEFYPTIGIIAVNDFLIRGYDTMDEWLDILIKKKLELHGKVLVIPDEEDLIYNEHIYMKVISNILNNYKNEEVYFVTQYNTNNEDWLLLYETYNISCKIVELPWTLLNDCITFDAIKPFYKFNHDKKNDAQYNYLCMTGRPSEHKINLVNELYEQKLHHYGLLTYKKGTKHNYYNNLWSIMIENDPIVSIDEENNIIGQEYGGISINNITTSCNVRNTFNIIEEYDSIPLIIHSESFNGLFFSTEKSIWPILTEKLFLIDGRFETMAWIQRFYDIDISLFANIQYDTIHGYNNDEGCKHRTKQMIIDNQELIQNSFDIYSDLKPLIQNAASKLGENLFNFSIHQLKQIINGNILLPKDIVNVGNS